MLLILRIFIICVLLFLVGWAGISKIIIEELNMHCRTYEKKDTLYYRELHELQSRISIMPAFLWESTKLILKIEKELREEN